MSTVTKKLTRLAMAVVVTATVTACSSTTETAQRAYIIEQSNADSFLALIIRTAALAGRHSVLPASVDTRSTATPPPLCPSDNSDGIKLVIGGCESAAEGIVACGTLESYDCKMISGSITGTVLATVGKGATLTLKPTKYKEGNNDLDTSEVSYDGMMQIDTGTDSVSYTEDQQISAQLTDGTVIAVDASGEYKIALGADKFTFSGKVSYDVEGVGLVNATISDMTFSLEGDCSGMPDSGTIKVEIVGLESGLINFTGCNTYDLINYDLGGLAAKTTSFGKDTVGLLFENAMQRKDLLTFAKAPFNATPAAMYPYSNTDVGVLGSRTTWCRMFSSAADAPMFAQPSAVTSPEAAAAVAAGAPQAECLTFAAMGPIQTSKGSVNSKTIIAAHVVFAGPLSDASKTYILSSQAGLPVSYPTDGTMSVTLANLANPVLYPTQESLSDAAEKMMKSSGPNPYEAGKMLPVVIETSYDFNHLGMWLESLPDGKNAGLYFNILSD